MKKLYEELTMCITINFTVQKFVQAFKNFVAVVFVGRVRLETDLELTSQTASFNTALDNKHLLTDSAASADKYFDQRFDVRTDEVSSARRAEVRVFFTVDQAIG